VLENFKEISRLMTSNYLKNKLLDDKIKKNQASPEEKQSKQHEDEYTQKMTVILKKMN